MLKTPTRSPRRRWPCWLLAASMLTGSMLATTAVADGTGGLFFDTVDINIVNVEVIVTDREGRPVTGLTREDFELFEEGEPVEISNFFAVENQVAVVPGAVVGDPADELSAPQPETRQLSLVIFIDDTNIKPQTRNEIFTNLRRYLDQGLAEDDQVMVVRLDSRLEVVQEFTADPERLAASLDLMEGKVGTSSQIDMPRRILMREIESTPMLTNTATDLTLEDYTETRAHTSAQDVGQLADRLYRRGVDSTRILAEFSDSLAGLPGRKAILYLSDGISLRPADPLVQAWLNHFQDWALTHDRSYLRQEVASLSAMDLDLSKAFELLGEHASSNRVAFYPISSKNAGFVGNRASAETYGPSVASSGSGARGSDVRALDNNLRQVGLIQLAGDTGGLAYTSSANIGQLLDAVKGDFQTFYSLGYSAPPLADDEDARFRRIEVKIRGDQPRKERYQVRHLKGYKPQDPLERLRQLTLAACHYGRVDNALEVELDPGEHHPGEKAGQFRVPVLVKIPFDKLLLLPEEAHHSGRVSMFVVVRDPAGGTSPLRRVELPIQVPNERILEAMGQAAAYPLQLELGEGPKRISVGLRDHLARIDATLNLELDVGSNPAPPEVASADPVGGQ